MNDDSQDWVMTFEDYLKIEFAQGKIDFSLRFDGISFYVHPTGKDGNTTPNFVPNGNVLSIAPGCFHPAWSWGK